MLRIAARRAWHCVPRSQYSARCILRCASGAPPVRAGQGLDQAEGRSPTIAELMDEIEAEEAVVGRDFNLKPPRDARWQSWRKTATSVVGWGAAGLGLAYGLMHFPVHVKLFAAVAAQPSWSWHFLAAHAAGFGGLGLHRGLCNGTAYLALDSGWLDQALGAVKGLDGVRVSSIREWAHFRVVWQPQLAYWYDDLLSQPQMLHNMPSFPHIIRSLERLHADDLRQGLTLNVKDALKHVLQDTMHDSTLAAYTTLMTAFAVSINQFFA